MPDLNTSIGHWRRALKQRATLARREIDELESHLRDAIEIRMRSGDDEESALCGAIKQVGEIDQISREYHKEHSFWRRWAMSTGHVMLAILSFLNLMLVAALMVVPVAVIQIWTHAEAISFWSTGAWPYLTIGAILAVPVPLHSLIVNSRASVYTTATGCAILIVFAGMMLWANLQPDRTDSIGSSYFTVMAIGLALFAATGMFIQTIVIHRVNRWQACA